MDEVKAVVKTYIIENFLPGVSADELEDTTPLITGGILDSLGTLKFLQYLEGKYQIEFQAHEVSVDYLDTVRDIVHIVRSKQG